MAINPETQYPGKVNPGDADYPYGSARNVTTPGDGTGYPWEAAGVKDWQGFFQALLFSAGIAPNGNPDTAISSQYLSALQKLLPTSLEGVGEDFAGRAVLAERMYVVRGWFQDQEFGGGLFVALPNEPKSSHDGGIFISPTVPAVSAQAGATPNDRRDNFVNGVGETDPGGNGVFARLSSDMPQLTWFGGVNLNDTVPVQAAKAAVQSNSNEATTYQWAGNMVIGDRPLPFSASIRDAFQVSRFIDGKTDCHAFADKTIIQNATDAGTYGTFDSETVVEGSHIQNHQFSFQDRAKYNGSGTLQTWGNIYWPEMNGSGTVDLRHDIEIKDVSGAGGTISAHIGVYVRDLQRANSNVAINLEQSSGFAVFAPNAGKWEIGGELKSKASTILGDTTAIAGVPVTWKSDGAGNQKGFLASNSEAATVAVLGDNRIELVTNAGSRLVVEDSSEGYAVRPATSSQNLGTDGVFWNQVKAKGLVLAPVAPGSAENLSLFVDNTDGRVKFKDVGGSLIPPTPNVVYNTPWQAFNADAAFNVKAMKDGNVVHLSGRAEPNGAGSLLVCTLPVGSRPIGREVKVLAADDSASQDSVLTIGTDGTVTLNTAVTAWVSFEGVSFVVERA